MPRHVLLIVEDDPDVRDSLSYLLEGEGYETIRAGDGRQALDALARGVRPCLILLDMMMPGLNGEDFRQVRLAHPVWRDFPVALYTGDGRAAEKARRPGVPLSFQKPLERIRPTSSAHCRRSAPDGEGRGGYGRTGRGSCRP